MHYRVNEPHVISETIGEETIIVNLGSGHYFSLNGTGVDVWDGVVRQLPAAGIASEVAARYEASDGEVETAVETFLADLAREELIVPVDETTDGPATSAPNPAGTGTRLPFAPPTLAKFTDMQDIILLDPVHEVDARGWPHAPAGS